MENIQTGCTAKKHKLLKPLRQVRMSTLRNNKGIALVTSLIFTLISLGIIMALLSIVTQGTRVSGASKSYKTSMDAGYGAIRVLTRDVLPAIFKGVSILPIRIIWLDLCNRFGIPSRGMFQPESWFIHFPLDRLYRSTYKYHSHTVD